MTALQSGDLAEVLSLPSSSGKAKPKFAVGDQMKVAKVSPLGAVCVEGHGGYWSARHFAKVGL